MKPTQVTSTKMLHRFYPPKAPVDNLYFPTCFLWQVLQWPCSVLPSLVCAWNSTTQTHCGRPCHGPLELGPAAFATTTHLLDAGRIILSLRSWKPNDVFVCSFCFVFQLLGWPICLPIPFWRRHWNKFPRVKQGPERWPEPPPCVKHSERFVLSSQ